MAKNLGFGTASDKLREAAQLQPRPITEPDPSPAEVERQIASQPGIIRQSPPDNSGPVLLRKRKQVGPTNPLNFRLPIGQFNRFVALSTRWDKTYSETLEILMDAAGVSPDGNVDDLRK
jgi:hypothetical protein